MAGIINNYTQKKNIANKELAILTKRIKSNSTEVMQQAVIVIEAMRKYVRSKTNRESAGYEVKNDEHQKYFVWENILRSIRPDEVIEACRSIGDLKVHAALKWLSEYKRMA